MKLQVGKQYRDRNGSIWVCYRIDLEAPIQGQANCIHTGNDGTDYFYLDGRWREKGDSPYCLIEEVKDSE